MTKRWKPLLFCLLSMTPLACSRAEGDQVAQAPPPFVLSAAETRLARELAEERLDIVAQPTNPLERTCLIKIDLLPDHPRLVMVHHYRYRDDVTVLTMVDLVRQEVVHVDSQAQYPTALCQEELERAQRLARNDSRLKAILAARGPDPQLDGRPLQIADRNAARFGHRLVQLLLRAGDRNLVGPRVVVDLTTETVAVEE